jgi:hypothetical protein
MHAISTRLLRGSTEEFSPLNRGFTVLKNTTVHQQLSCFQPNCFCRISPASCEACDQAKEFASLNFSKALA